MNLRCMQKLVLVIGFVALVLGTTHAEEPIATPSEKMKEAVGKLNKAPATIGQSLQGLRDAAAAKLKQTLGAGAKPDAKAAPVDLDLPQKAAEIPADASALKENGRDPFRPMTLRSKVTSRQRENLSPLERFELGQLKIVGIVWDIKEPRAMIEDTAGLGYVVKIGTPIGSNDGRVKTIHRDQIIIEENYTDTYGGQKKRDVRMRLSTE